MAASRNTLLAELGSLSLEFTRLSQITGDPKYFDAVQRVADNLAHAQPHTMLPGLWPILIDAQGLDFEDSRFTLGGMADSTYEYLPKEYLLLGGGADQYQKMYEAAVDSVEANLLFRPLTEKNEDILFSGSARATAPNVVSLEPEGQHLSCFVGGMMGIGAKIFNRPNDLSIARKLVNGCIWAYNLMPTGLMPEIFHMATCDDKLDCPWDEKKWHDQVRQAAVKAGVVSPGNDDPSAIIQELGLQPGLTSVKDGRYILRYRK
jgi:mannosyl-oligosaccharide alpha-1,2-mannosidase